MTSVTNWEYLFKEFKVYCNVTLFEENFIKVYQIIWLITKRLTIFLLGIWKEIVAPTKNSYTYH